MYLRCYSKHYCLHWYLIYNPVLSSTYPPMMILRLTHDRRNYVFSKLSWKPKDVSLFGSPRDSSGDNQTLSPMTSKSRSGNKRSHECRWNNSGLCRELFCLHAFVQESEGRRSVHVSLVKQARMPGYCCGLAKLFFVSFLWSRIGTYLHLFPTL